MRSRELWLVQENHATVKLDWNSFSGMKTVTAKAELTSKSKNLKENAGKFQAVFCYHSSPVNPGSHLWDKHMHKHKHKHKDVHISDIRMRSASHVGNILVPTATRYKM